MKGFINSMFMLYNTNGTYLSTQCSKYLVLTVVMKTNTV